MELFEQIANIGIVPVVKISDPQDALPLAKALYQGGIPCAEITFRSAYAQDAIKQLHDAFPDMVLGAGTVSTKHQVQVAMQAGASFIVTPGFNEEVVRYCLDQNIPIFPGVSSATDIELALSYGLTKVKFFPAQSSGGAQKIKDLSAPYANVTFLPTGGINEKNMHEYLSLPCVMAIGGSFMLPQEKIDAKDFHAIEELSRKAVKEMLSYELIHLGINSEHMEEAQATATLLCELFNFTMYQKPKSNFAGKGFEILHQKGRGTHGHIGIYTPYPERALYNLQRKGISVIEESITRNKKTKLINFAYLDIELSGFAIHLINPDLKMEV